jgi:hypothetical protein
MAIDVTNKYWQNYVSLVNAHGQMMDAAQQLPQARIDKLMLTWHVLNGTWIEYQYQPPGVRRSMWYSLMRRFKVTDLATPTLNTMVNAAYGCRIERNIVDAVNKPEVERFLADANNEEMEMDWATESAGYGTGYQVPGWDSRDRPTFIGLNPVTTEIITDPDDMNDVMAIDAVYDGYRKRYTNHGVYIIEDNSRPRLIPNTDYGFIPVCIARGRKGHCRTPYGDQVIWPAVGETKQCTFLDNDIMVLEKAQSFATLVIKGRGVDNMKDVPIGPFVSIRLHPDDAAADAKYISPETAIDKINALVESKFERVAAQCQVPIHIFTRSKAGTDQKTGAAALSHEPLYAFATTFQNRKIKETKERLAIVDAMISFRKAGSKNPVDLEMHRRKLKFEMKFHNNVSPAMNMQEVQVWKMLYEDAIVSFEEWWRRYHENGTEDEFKEALKRREKLDSQNELLFKNELKQTQGVG